MGGRATWLHDIQVCLYAYACCTMIIPLNFVVSIFSSCEVHSSDTPQVYEQRPGVLLQHAQLNQL